MQDSLIKIIYAQRYNEGQIIIGFLSKLYNLITSFAKRPRSLMSKEVWKNIKDTDSSSQCLKVYYFNPRLGEEQIRQTSKEENNVQLKLKKEMKAAVRDIV